jgi:hypothetical protein
MTQRIGGCVVGALVACVLAFPLSAQQPLPKQKQLFQAQVGDELVPGVYFQVGQGMIVASSTGFDVLVRDSYYALRIDRVTLTIAGDPLARRVVLCDDNAGLTCSPNYTVYIRGPIDAAMLLGAENGAITPEEFAAALADGELQLLFNEGAFGIGTFTRVQ